MFGYWRKRRKLFREFKEWEKESAAKSANPNDPQMSFDPLDPEPSRIIRELDILDTHRLLKKARKLGIDVEEELPRDSAQRVGDGWISVWWYEGAERILSEKGRARLINLISEKRYALAKKWTDLLAPLLSTVISILALLLAAFALYLQAASDPIIVVPPPR